MTERGARPFVRPQSEDVDEENTPEMEYLKRPASPSSPPLGDGINPRQMKIDAIKVAGTGGKRGK